ncbi:PUA-like domain-containing protein [Mycena rebaudengoi]|nr:PUA-like domain-containing protein [Mycena rebaudengoi]
MDPQALVQVLRLYARHTHSAPCPVPACVPASGSSLPRIPQNSRVHYLAPPPAPPPQPQPVAVPKLDVSLNKILALLDRALADTQDQDDTVPVHPNDDDDDDAASDYNDQPLRSSGIRPRSASFADAVSRPRKRPRLQPAQPDPDDEDDGDLLAHLLAASARQQNTLPQTPLLAPPRPPDQPPRGSNLANLEKDLMTELSCEICFNLLYCPVTTPCQHTFCAKCLHRSLDHNSLCPLCRDTLPGFSFFEEHPCNQVLETLLLKAFPAMYTERGEAIEEEERGARLDTPIFVCMLVFPGTPTALHFFEPRYRLMLRRCLEADVPSFGMIMPARQGAGGGVQAASSDYGTMLEVRSVQMLADGRSMVETWSTYRFRILERGTLDGYTVARIERIDDIPDEDTLDILPSPLPTNAALMETCTQFLMQLRRGTAPWVVQRLNNVVGPPPADPAAFSYWVALVLPIDEYEKAKLLPIRSARMRLRLVAHWIEQLNNNWWFASGCTIV